jgi:hypothetical protein
MNNMIAKPAPQYGSGVWVLREDDNKGIEASAERFLRPLLGVSLGDEIRSTDIRKSLGTERMVEEIQEYQR